MDAYPPEYIAHNFPLVVLSGLSALPEDEQEQPNSRGPLIRAQSPLVKSERKDELLQDFLKATGDDQDWSGKGSRLANPVIGYRFKVVGRVCLVISVLCAEES